MEVFFLIAVVPLLLPWILRLVWPHEISWLEMGASMAASLLVVGAIYGGGLYSQALDYEVWSGQVTSKAKERVSCEHSYSCNCTTDSKGNQTCQTCYDHPYDWDWTVSTNIEHTFRIKRIDRQGNDQPPRWTLVKLGDPVSKTSSFTNYVKAAPDSLFHHDTATKQFENMIPLYPLEIYDYYKIDRVITVGVPVPDLSAWNANLSMLMRRLGPHKQANVVVVLVNTLDQSYLEAIRAQWLGGKKNDVIVVIGSRTYPKIDWAGIISWTDNEQFKVELRDDLLKIGTVDRMQVLSAIDHRVMTQFKRKDMKDFEYLKYQIEPPVWVLILAFILGMVVSLGSSYYFYHNDPFETGGNRYRPRRRF